MKFIETEISDVIIIEPNVFGDARGYFLESYNQKRFEEGVGKTFFVQDNESKSSKGVLRGLHFQKPPCDYCKNQHQYYLYYYYKLSLSLR